MRFRDRADAGRQLGLRLAGGLPGERPLVLGLARGGVAVAREVALAVDGELDVLVVRKLGAPSQPELAIGAVASGGGRALNSGLIEQLGLDIRHVWEAAAREAAGLDARARRYRGDRPSPQPCGRPVILVDDGLATGATMRAAVASVSALRPARLTVAVPVGAPDTVAGLREAADDVVCLLEPEPFLAVGEWYERFDPVDDDEVVSLLG